ncbi:MAG TPA: energy transducer TonB [Syntrophorhabdaceae bacterium]|nr:energy transducer TonB [Syntrophorhabdaceae bacterium]
MASQITFGLGRDGDLSKAFLISLLVHALAITIAIMLVGTDTLRHLRPLVVYLTDEGPGAGSAKPNVMNRAKDGRASRIRHDEYRSVTGQTEVTRQASPDELFAKNVHLSETIDSKQMETQKPDPTPVTSLTLHDNQLSVSSERPRDEYGLGTKGAGHSADSAGEGSGSDGKRASGTGGPGHGETNSLSALYLQQQFAYIRELILKNLKYPSIARTMGWKGVVTVSFTVMEDGKADNIRVVKSSGHEVFDQTVMRAIREIQPFPKPPVRAQLVIPITFRLE